MPNSAYTPRIDFPLAGLELGRERLESGCGVAVERRPFSQAFYRATYPEIAAYPDGAAPDPRQIPER